MKTSPEELSILIAGELLRIGAVSLSPETPYTWASGLRSPVYCDNRMLLGYPDIRSLVADSFVELIRLHDLECDVIGGIATAGIPHAAWIAERMNKPMIYVRGEVKTHGRQRQIEGEVESGKRVVLIEDLVSTGKSSLAVIAPLRNAGFSVSGVLAIFTYGLEQSRTAFLSSNTPLFTLTDFPTLIRVARDSGKISDANLASLQAWYQDPARWSETISG